MPFRRSFLAFCILASLAGGCALAAAPDASPPPLPHIWSGLIFATNPARPAQAPSRLSRYVEKLKRIFGYDQYELVGESSEKLDGVNERWLVPSKDFYMSVTPHTGPGHNPARVTLFQSKRKVAEFETHLSPDSPLFIRGPQYGGGQLVIVVHMVNEPEPTPAAILMQQRPGAIIIGPTPLGTGAPHKDKTGAPGMTNGPQQDRITPVYPGPAGGPDSLDHFGPGYRERFGPMPGGPGGLDPKLNRP